MYSILAILIIGIATGITLIVINMRARRSLLGSFFKRSYGLATIGCILFTLGFVMEIFRLFGYDYIALEVAHHALLVLSLVFFTLVGTNFPKEANEVLSEKKLEK
jgi:hypothetical protein